MRDASRSAPERLPLRAAWHGFPLLWMRFFRATREGQKRRHARKAAKSETEYKPKVKIHFVCGKLGFYETFCPPESCADWRLCSLVGVNKALSILRHLKPNGVFTYGWEGLLMALSLAGISNCWFLVVYNYLWRYFWTTSCYNECIWCLEDLKIYRSFILHYVISW